MTNKERIIEILEQSADGLCDDCLAKFSEVRPRQQVNQICRALSDRRIITRTNSICTGCSSSKKVNVLKRSNNKIQDLGPELLKIKSEEFSEEKTSSALDKMRREIIKTLNKIEKIKSSDRSLAQRISSLRDNNRIPGNIGCLMLTINSFRNLAVYEQYNLSEKEFRVINNCWEIISDWINKLSNFQH